MDHKCSRLRCFFEEADKSGIIAKLQQTVQKYEDVDPQIDIINIVVDNLTCLLYLKYLARFKRNHQAWEEDHTDINIYTVDLGQEELIPMREIVSRMSAHFLSKVSGSSFHRSN